MISRRAFLQASVLLPYGFSDAARTFVESPRVNAGRLQQSIDALSRFGRPPGGAFGDGVTRVAYSEADIAGRTYVVGLMRNVGLETRIDAAGNIIGRRNGSEPSLPPILFGSHIDSVPNGGNFDGDLGSLAAIETVLALHEQNMRTRHPLEVVIWANEEGVAYGKLLCGSRAAAGRLAEGELDQIWNGTSKRDAIRGIGGTPERIEDARRGPFHCYLELHIEQGGTLAARQVSIGIVEGIVATDRYEAVIQGFANHAGTTPMAVRQDALLAASHLTIAVNEVANAEQGRQVGTVGQITVMPNVPNVVPGVARCTIELRDLSAATIARMGEAIRRRAALIAQQTRTQIEITQTSHDDSAMATAMVQEAIGAVTSRLALRSVGLPSGAVHDAQVMARLGPMGMIFVPSIGGVSHSPKELTSWEDCAHGANVLLNAVLEIDGKELQ